jgi:hypothetical protein
MSTSADLLCAALAREIAESGIRVYAVTSPATAAAGLAARELGAPGLALASGFTALDGSPVPQLTLGERGLFTAGPALRDDPFDTFALLARGRVGVAVAPAQLDVRGQTNLSGVGGQPGRPKVALPGARGLPDNNAGPSRVWYLLPAHGPRQLVASVDVVCGAAPPPTSVRRLLTPAGCFALGPEGWTAQWLTPDGAELVAAAEAFPIAIDGAPIVDAPQAEALAALQRADPRGARAVEFAGGREAAELFARIGTLEHDAVS